MKPPWWKSWSWVGAAEVLAALPGYGFAGLAAVMAVVGQFALALVFGVIACGVFVRLWRARRGRARR